MRLVDLDWIEYLVNNTNNKVNVLWAHLHPLLHSSIGTKQQREELNNNLTSVLHSLEEQVESIRVRAVYSAPVL